MHALLAPTKLKTLGSQGKKKDSVHLDKSLTRRLHWPVKLCSVDFTSACLCVCFPVSVSLCVCMSVSVCLSVSPCSLCLSLCPLSPSLPLFLPPLSLAKSLRFEIRCNVDDDFNELHNKALCVILSLLALKPLLHLSSQPPTPSYDIKSKNKRYNL